MAADERDRRNDGRPEQTRPRDRTGRPLPYGTVGVPLTEDHEPATVEEALETGAELWDQGRYFEAHECLEHVWHAAPEDDRDLWQGVIQVAVAGVHLQRGNLVGVRALLQRAGERLSRYPDQHRGVEVAETRGFCLDAMASMDSGDGHGIALPPFPATVGGVWFTPDPELVRPLERPTPVPAGPTWRAAGKLRSPRSRPDPPGADPPDPPRPGPPEAHPPEAHPPEAHPPEAKP